MEGGDAWVLASTALVLFMTPGLALFYGGMTRSKNVLNMLLMNFYCLGIVPILWVGFTSSLAGNGTGAWIGNFDLAGLKGLDGQGILFTAFFMTFAVITPALISGAVADRMKFSAWAIFVPVWSILVYAPVTYWVYGLDADTGDLIGFLGERGSLDFAGGTAIHINAGVAALALVLVLGKRRGWPKQAMPPHNLPLVLIGTGILWFGWFGFNSGAAPGIGGVGLTATALMNTFLAASAGMVAWLVVERLRDGHFTILGACSGVVAGLVAITPAAAFVGGLAGIAFGVIAAVCCYFAIQLKTRLGYDDSLDVVGVHMVGGIVGGLLIGFFADMDIVGNRILDDGVFSGEYNSEYFEGLLFGGDAELLVEQAFSIVFVLVFSFIVSFAIAKVLDIAIGIRVDEAEEETGLDGTQHAESGYNIGDLGSLSR